MLHCCCCLDICVYLLYCCVTHDTHTQSDAKTGKGKDRYTL